MMTRIVAANLTDLHREPSFLSELMTQVFNGAALEILEEKDKWYRVKSPDGYEGWAHAPYLTDAPPPQATHIVAANSVGIFSEPDHSDAPISCLLAGTNVHVDDVRGEWARVVPAGSMIPSGWICLNTLRPLANFPLASAAARKQMILDAQRQTGVYYLWGGNSAFGTDCSGLTHMVHRLSGYSIPRDAHPQFHTGKVVAPPFEPGDLLFFRSDKNPDRIGHVGISVGGMRMIHSSRSRNGVYEEDIEANENLSRGFAGGRIYVDR